jgi:hypothetical protein
MNSILVCAARQMG